MALLGTLKGFGVTEIFQLISQQMKTGSLILTSPNAKVTIEFEEGIIIGISSDQWLIDPRADVLIKGGFIYDTELKSALDHKKASQEWHDILINQGKLKMNFLEKATNVVIKNILLEIFQWKEGSYRFEDWDMDTKSMLSCHIPTEGIILDTLRMIDEWPLIKQKIPPVDYCPVVIIPLTEDVVNQYDLSESDMRIFDLIDEARTVENIVKESLETQFDALNSIVRLIDCGLIEVFPKGTKDMRDYTAAKMAFFANLKKASVFILLGIIITILLLLGETRITKLTLIDPEINRQIIVQREMARDFAEQDTWLLKIDKDSYDR